MYIDMTIEEIKRAHEKYLKIREEIIEAAKDYSELAESNVAFKAGVSWVFENFNVTQKVKPVIVDTTP